MSVTAGKPAPPDQPIRPRRWTREEYYRAADLGLFGPEEQLGPLDSEIYAKRSPRKPSHITALGRDEGSVS